jgi:hypothetical protein
MNTLRIENNLPAKVNSKQLQSEIASALNLSESEVALEIVLGGLTIIRSTPKETTEEIFPPFISVTVPSGTSLEALPALIAAHAPEKSDEEAILAQQAAELKSKLAALASDPEMIALIKGAVNS